MRDRLMNTPSACCSHAGKEAPMNRRNVVRWTIAGMFAAAACAEIVFAGQAPTVRRPGQSAAGTPLPQGRSLEAKDGDTVYLDGNARVRVIRRNQGFVRAVFDPAQRWVVLLVDNPSQPGGAPDGLVDRTYEFRELEGNWPLGERWEGEAVIEEYSMATQPAPRGIGLRLPQGLVQIAGGMDNGEYRDPSAVAVLFSRGSGAGGGVPGAPGVPFDEAERRAIETAQRNADLRRQLPPNMSVGVSGATLIGGAPAGAFAATTTLTTSSGEAPIRVGGTVRAPQKLYDVAPVLPELARQAGVRGLVILEITIGTDGSVADARVLRSIPLLDAAALEAARQWRYEPTSLNGRPVPVILTVPVSFQ
jgi:TonB family protein